GNGLLRVGIEASVAHSTIGRIAHHSTEHARGKKRWYLADVTLDNADAVCQAIAGDILLCECRERGLEFQPNKTCMRETACQQQPHDSTTGAEIDERVGRCRWDKICE